jgi:hypothetical protein
VPQQAHKVWASAPETIVFQHLDRSAAAQSSLEAVFYNHHHGFSSNQDAPPAPQ